MGFQMCVLLSRKLLNLYEVKQTKQGLAIQKAEGKFHSYFVFEVSSICYIKWKIFRKHSTKPTVAE